MDSPAPISMQRLYNGILYVSDDLDGAPIKIGSRVCKINSEENDTTPNGTQGLVIGSISILIDPAIDGQSPDHCYTIVWDDKKQVPIGTIGRKLLLISPPKEPAFTNQELPCSS